MGLTHPKWLGNITRTTPDIFTSNSSHDEIEKLSHPIWLI